MCVGFFAIVDGFEATNVGDASGPNEYLFFFEQRNKVMSNEEKENLLS